MSNLVTLEPKGKVVFVGDTHGDIDSSEHVIGNYLRPGHKIVFLGDYVDRGYASLRNIQYLMKKQQENSQDVFLLAGNHEGYMTRGFDGASFWESLNESDKNYYAYVFKSFPLAVSVGSVIATHGALPDIKDMTKFDEIQQGDDHWKEITWGDFTNLRQDMREGLRHEFSQSYFKRVMGQLGKNVLIRSHQSQALLSMYGGRCVTVYTTNYFGRNQRSIAIADFDLRPEIKTIDDLIIEEF